MPTFKLPLSGDVVQSINPFTAFMTGGQFGLININLGQSSEPKVEEEVLSDVATYGKQLGRIGDALIVLLEHFHPRKPLTADETKAIEALKTMLDKIADVKEKYKRPAIRPGEARRIRSAGQARAIGHRQTDCPCHRWPAGQGPARWRVDRRSCAGRAADRAIFLHRPQRQSDG